MSNPRYLPKYKNTVVDLNKWYSFLLKRMTVGDYRVTYLRTFETILDANCPFALKENARYIRLTDLYPLPGRKQKKVSEDKFRIYMELYNFIMRDAGLLDRESVEDSNRGINDRALRG